MKYSHIYIYQSEGAKLIVFKRISKRCGKYWYLSVAWSKGKLFTQEVFERLTDCVDSVLTIGKTNKHNHPAHVCSSLLVRTTIALFRACFFNTESSDSRLS